MKEGKKLKILTFHQKVILSTIPLNIFMNIICFIDFENLLFKPETDIKTQAKILLIGLIPTLVAIVFSFSGKYIGGLLRKTSLFVILFLILLSSFYVLALSKVSSTTTDIINYRNFDDIVNRHIKSEIFEDIFPARIPNNATEIQYYYSVFLNEVDIILSYNIDENNYVKEKERLTIFLKSKGATIYNEEEQSLVISFKVGGVESGCVFYDEEWKIKHYYYGSW